MAKRIRLVEKRPVICHEAGLIRLVVCDLSSLFSHYSVPLLSPCDDDVMAGYFWSSGRGPPSLQCLPVITVPDTWGLYNPGYRHRGSLQETYHGHCVSLPTISLYHTALCCAWGAYLPCLGWLAGVIGLCIFFIVMPLIRVMSYRGFKKDHVTTNSSSLSYSNTGYQYKYLFNFFHYYWIRPCFV